MNLEYKVATTGQLLSADDQTGVVEALVSITGITDEQDDIVVPGAYAKTLAKRRMKGVRFHDWARPVAKTLEQQEWAPGDPRLPATLPDGQPWPADAGALYVKGHYNLAVQDGRDAYETAKFFGEEGQWSIGYRPAKGGAKRRSDGKRLLTDVELYEWSDVLHGAAPQTSTLSVKTAEEAADHPGDGTDGGPDDGDADLEGKYDPSQARAGDGTWSASGSGGDSGRARANGPAGPGTGWLQRVMAGDSRLVASSGGAGRDTARDKEKTRRADSTEAFRQRRMQEKKRRLAADRAIGQISDADGRKAAKAKETDQRAQWQEQLDADWNTEMEKRHQWDAEHRGGKKALMAADPDPEPVDDIAVVTLDVLDGSFEELRERVRAAAADLFTEPPVVVGTYDDWAVVHGDGQLWQVEFGLDEAGELHLGDVDGVELDLTDAPDAAMVQLAATELVEEATRLLVTADAAGVKTLLPGETLAGLSFAVGRLARVAELPPSNDDTDGGTADEPDPEVKSSEQPPEPVRLDPADVAAALSALSI